MCGKIYQKCIVIVHFHCLKNTTERMSYQIYFVINSEFFFKQKLLKKDGLTKSFEISVYSSVFLICN